MRSTIFFVIVSALFVAGCGDSKVTQDKTQQKTVSGESAGGAGDDVRFDDDGSATPADEAGTKKKAIIRSDIEVVYTDLAENKCEDVDINEDEAWSVQKCAGAGGYSLNVSEGDLRQTIDVIAPDGKKLPLEMWSVVSSGFSTVGNKAEWRVKKVGGKSVPYALIVRYNVNENPDDTEKITSYLTVSKITPSGACITDVVKPIRNANEKARELADVSANKVCLKKSSPNR